MKNFSIACAVAIIAMITTPVSASVWTSSISYDGLVDVVQDNSVSFAFVENGDGIVSAGDVIAGVIKWEVNIADGDSFGNHAISVFAATVLGTSGAGPTLGTDPSILFSIGSATTTLDLLLPTLSASVGGFSPGTVGVTLSRPGGPDPTTLALGASTLLIDSTYSLDFEFGLVTASDYFEAALRDHRVIPPGGGAGAPGADGVISITDSDTDGYIDEYDDFVGAGPGTSIFPGTGLIGRESGGFSVIRDFSTGAGYALLPTTTLAGTPGPGTGMAQIVLSETTTLIQPTANQAANGYQFADQSIILLNPSVPEPGSILMWAGLSCLGAFALRRKRKS
jgi:hypothetical protein